MITKIKIHGYRIYKDFVLEPNKKLNLLVGGNESGKSTLIEAISLALTGRINGRSFATELNPHWFNTEIVDEFLQQREAGELSSFPEIRIELFFKDSDELQALSGAINSEVPTVACPGVLIRAAPNPKYEADLAEWASEPSPLLPVEYYKVEWRSFADSLLNHRPKELATAIIDSRTVRSNTGVDYHLREILSDSLSPPERAAISLAYRQVKSTMTDTKLNDVNGRIANVEASLHNIPISLAMDQSARTSWESSITPHVGRVPFSMSGQGQQAAIKISLAMNKHSRSTTFVMVEEPENHLTHTSLTTLLSRMELLAGEHQQLFISTHSSFVLNRLGMDSLLLMSRGAVHKIPDLDPDTISYFQRLPGYDTLRIVLARKLVLVEGPSDEIIFERIYSDIHGIKPMECGIDVLSLRGLSFKRCLELCAKLGKRVAALRDNDGRQPDELCLEIQNHLDKHNRQMFVGSVKTGKTLEPQLLHHNSENKLRKILGITDKADLLTWMSREKTETALRIAKSNEVITPPDYMAAAANFIHG